MLLTPIVDRAEIRKYYALFRKRLSLPSKKKRKIGNRKGAEELPLSIHEDLGFWVFLSSEVDAQSWNPFGDLEGAYQNPRAALPMVCQINFPHEGIDRRISGLFAKDDRGRVYVTHSGRLGGGRKGIGKASFLDYIERKRSSVQWADIDWPRGQPSRYIVIGNPAAVDFRKQIAEFVHLSAEYKESIVGGKAGKTAREKPTSARHGAPADFVDGIYTRGFAGKRRAYSINRKIEVDTYHDYVVDALHGALSTALKDYHIGKTQAVDLFVRKPPPARLLVAVFEVKTAPSLSSVYSAIGQLTYHGSEAPTRVMVLPDAPAAMIKHIESLGMRVLSYHWKTRKTPAFTNLKRIVAALRHA